MPWDSHCAGLSSETWYTIASRSPTWMDGSDCTHTDPFLSTGPTTTPIPTLIFQINGDTLSHLLFQLGPTLPPKSPSHSSHLHRWTRLSISVSSTRLLPIRPSPSWFPLLYCSARALELRGIKLITSWKQCVPACSLFLFLFPRKPPHCLHITPSFLRFLGKCDE